MNRWTRFAAAGFVLALAACGDTSAGSPLAPEAPSFDNGLIVGGNKTSTDTVTFKTEASDTTSRGGGLIVGGN